jgi:hypothetical protein
VNSLALVVDGGPSSITSKIDTVIPNFAYATVTICAPGSTTNCQSIDHVQIDTQSVGLRVMGSVLNATLLAALKPSTTSGGSPVFECAPFADGYSWGPVSSVDIAFTSSERASSVPIQVIEDPAVFGIPTTPADCVSAAGTNYAENSPVTFEANGLLGIGTLLTDCGAICASGILEGSYYSCTSSTSTGSCTDITMSVSAQVQNPVAKLSGNDTNGVVIQLGAVAAPGAASASGTLYFGVGTESNNALGSATVFPVDTEYGQFITTQYAGSNLDMSVLDVGSSAYYFNSSITQCASSDFDGYYCPSSTANESATIQGQTSIGVSSGSAVTENFQVGNAETLYAQYGSYAALPTLAGTGTTGTFDWGLPFFFGKTFFVVFEGDTAAGSSQSGPFMAF